ncbi:hypothetical protein BDM02DRAFT_2072554 [Thelephora ganbajun]|uniref:Uncharacterized protein n=1 Tax=Thelephora ganbajun TaxID=370292 RepID=A0ACB6ZGH7_THEGA|nr:hypothetical protein BDM02DRAFT_2072554 [Thelephora ganbajun]
MHRALGTELYQNVWQVSRLIGLSFAAVCIIPWIHDRELSWLDTQKTFLLGSYGPYDPSRKVQRLPVFHGEALRPACTCVWGEIIDIIYEKGRMSFVLSAISPNTAHERHKFLVVRNCSTVPLANFFFLFLVRGEVLANVSPVECEITRATSPVDGVGRTRGGFIFGACFVRITGNGNG